MPENVAKQIAWSDAYAIGVEEVDAQHQSLLDILNRLNGTVVREEPGTRRATGMLWEVFEELNEYAAYHFLTEERIMQAHLPGEGATARHISEHRGYWVTVAEFKQRHKDGDPQVARDLLVFLNNWWIDHILGTDMQMGAELNRKGVA